MKKINLSYLLDKNGIDLKSFCLSANISSYNQLVDTCTAKGYNCDIPTDEFQNPYREESVKKDEEKTQPKVEKKKRVTRRRGGKKQNTK